MVRMFLDKFFPASRAAGIRREIYEIKQKDTETLHEYWEIFKRLCPSCPQHGISEKLLTQYFYEELLPMERKMMDATNGGAIVNKTPHDARELISIMAANSQQFGFRKDISSIRVNEVGSSSIEHQLSHLTSFFQQLVVGKTQQVKACGICAAIGHPTDMCPTLQDDSHEYANAVGSYGPRPSKSHRFPPEQSSSKPARDNNKHTKFGESNESIGILRESVRIPRLAKSKKEAEEKEILETFHKIEVNIPLLDVIKQVPRYDTVLKELSTNKKKLKGNEKKNVRHQSSSPLHPTHPSTQSENQPSRHTTPSPPARDRYRG
ncbi:uncharacterized protein LOC120195161 [Hibiscus syriacus]|uniref:uncharacterized protein LOC120195161 n=1 Tax=Hibiscus syriacus TaxID=106335 RepID=UPI0019228183|nr:uncharacterized protein LOC120195161 [Hibiscus syriacus]